MNVSFVLVATGSVALPRIQHGFSFQTIENAKISAQEVAKALHKAGYFQFTLYDTRRINGADVQIATFRVEEQEPIVFMK